LHHHHDFNCAAGGRRIFVPPAVPTFPQVNPLSFARESLTQPGRESGMARYRKTGAVMRAIFLIFFIATFYATPSPAQADTISIDLESVGGTNPIVGPCVGGFCLHGFVSPLFSFHAGDTVDMGSVFLSPFIFGGRGTTSSYSPQYLISFGPISPANVPSPPIFASCTNINFVIPCNPPVSNSFDVPLYFTFTSDSELQIAWTPTALYFAPGVPEPSTWAMLLIGFAGIGFAHLSASSSLGDLPISQHRYKGGVRRKCFG
jgi:hypothetical protein